MITASEIKKMALDCGACEMIETAHTIADLVSLMGTPQGREFCKEHGFPSLDIMRKIRDELSEHDVYVDAGDIDLTDVNKVVVAGETNALLRFKTTSKPYSVIVMHGAKAKVIAYGYSVCQVVNVGGEVEVHESENASIFLR